MSESSPKLSIIIPAYRAAAFLQSSLEEVAAWVSSRKKQDDIEVIVVDDGSDDGTCDIVRAAMLSWPKGSELRLLQHSENRGKGAAVRMGMLSIRGEFAIFTDADLAYGLEPVDRICDLLEQGADMACGVRLCHVGFMRRIAGMVFRQYVRLNGLGDFADPQCGIKGFRSETAALLFGLSKVEGFAFDVELFAMAQYQGLSVSFLPVVMRTSEQTSVRLFDQALRMARSVREIGRWTREGAYEIPSVRTRSHKTVPEEIISVEWLPKR